MSLSSKQPTASNFYISKIYHLAARCGLDAGRLLHEADIPPDIVDAPGKRVDAEKLAKVFLAIWDELQDESMSLSKSPIPRGSFYMMGKLTIQELDLRKALRQLMRFYGMVTKAFTLNLSVENGKAMLTCVMHYPEMDRDHLFAEVNLLMLHRYSSWLIAENIPLSEVFFSYPVPLQIKEYFFLFPGKHVFNAPYMGFSFSAQYLDRKNVQTPNTLKSFMHRCPVELFLRPKSDFSLSHEIYSLLYKRIHNEPPSVEEVAKHLLYTKRTLVRKLKEEGSSFQQIKDIVRRDQSICYLSSQTLSMSEIAGKVGFSDASVFTRAFKTWTGFSPTEYRANFVTE